MDGIKLTGRISGLENGSSHGVHILEYADLKELIVKKNSDNIDEDVLKHFNPKRVQHGCPGKLDDADYHTGDFVNTFYKFIREIL